MIKKNWKTLLITSLLILLPALAGIVLWDQLPEQIPTHWNPSGEVDRWSSKAFAIFGLSGILLAAQWLCTLGTRADPKKDNHPQKILHLVLWIIPVISNLLYAITYAVALGKEVRIEVIMPVFMGLLFAIIGNYMPKCKQNYTIGIKIPWTLNSEENWNRTHRFAGRLWVVCGIVIMLTGFFGGFWIFFGIVLAMVIAPFLYSYLLHRKGV
ncbi:MAG: SdpI family protein [Oscillospiraceae bacterium]|nr:SdpI family protein [Oscillospiraceae bacterium]